jgi:hypothetical protein
MREYFDKQGRLYKIYESLNKEIRQAREKRKPVKQQCSVQAQSIPKTLVSDNPNQQLKDKRQRVENDQTPLPRSRRQPLFDTAGISCQQCRHKERKCERFTDNNLIGSTCSWCIHEGMVCSLSAGRKLRGAKANTPAIANIQCISQEQPPKSIAHQSSSHDVYQVQQMPGASKPNPPSQSIFDSIVTSHLSEKHALPEATHGPAAAPSQSQSTITVRTNAYERDRQVAVSAVHDTLQRQITRFTNACDTCRESPCSCDPTKRPADDIMCNGELCFKKWFSNDFLEKYMGIQLSDAEDFRRDYGFWCCPMCSYKKVKQDARGPNVFASTYILPKCGSETLDDEEVRQSLNEVWGLIGQYIRMAKKSPSMRMQPLLQIPCVRDEILDERYNPLIYVLRRILKVDQGRFVKNAVVDSQLQDLDPSIWMRAVLVFLFYEFIFQSGSPYDDVSIWRKGLVHSWVHPQCIACTVLTTVGFEPDLAETWVQDNRLRTMREGTGEYQNRRRDQGERHIRQLNPVMMPLIGGIGGNEGLHRIHIRIADIAGDLNAKFWAYTGTYKEIMPGIGDRFDPKYHVSDDPLDEFKDLSDRLIMLITMVGVQFHIPGKEWRISSRAKVRLWPSSEQAPASPDVSLPAPSASSDRRGGSRKRPYQDLTLS